MVGKLTLKIFSAAIVIIYFVALYLIWKGITIQSTPIFYLLIVFSIIAFFISLIRLFKKYNNKLDNYFNKINAITCLITLPILIINIFIFIGKNNIIGNVLNMICIIMFFIANQLKLKLKKQINQNEKLRYRQ